MAKKKKKKSKPVGLQETFEVGDEVTVKAVIEGIDEEGEPTREITKTPVRVTSVGRNCLGLRIIGRSWARRFIVGFVFEIENYEYKVLSETKMDAVVECLDEDLIA